MPRAEIAAAGRGDGAHPAHRPSARPAGLAALPAATASAWRSAAPSCASRKAFLMDEPLGTLDAEFRELMCHELRALHDRCSATTVYVTHDQIEAMAMADKIAVMNHGVIEQLGTPQEIYDRPATMFVADFIGSPPMNFLPLRRRRCERATTRVASTARTVAVPELREDVAPARAGARRAARARALRRRARRCAAQVSAAEYLGTTPDRDGRHRATASSRRAHAGATCRSQRGDHVGLAFDARAAVAVRQARVGRCARRATRSPRREARHG